MSRIFISHSSVDRGFVAQRLVRLLRALRFDVWYSPEDIRSAEHWERAIGAGLRSSQWFLLVMSPQSAESEWVRDELFWAMENLKGQIIPVLIRDCDPQAFHLRLSRIQHLDFRQDDQTAQETLIARLVDGEYAERPLLDVLKAVVRCPSKEIMTVVRIEARRDGQRAEIVASNAKADELFGRRSGLTIVGTSQEDLVRLLAPWMDSDDHEKFVNEQRELVRKAKEGAELFATVPIKLNSRHPVHHLRGRKFLPITVAYDSLCVLDDRQVVPLPS